EPADRVPRVEPVKRQVPVLLLELVPARDLHGRVDLAASRRPDEGRRARADPLNGRTGSELLDVDPWICVGHCFSFRQVRWRSYSPVRDGTSRSRESSPTPFAPARRTYALDCSRVNRNRPCPSLVAVWSNSPTGVSSRTHAPATSVVPLSTVPPMSSTRSPGFVRSCRQSPNRVVTAGPAARFATRRGTVTT